MVAGDHHIWIACNFVELTSRPGIVGASLGLSARDHAQSPADSEDASESTRQQLK
jgi:hypothetical protein